MTTCVKPIPDGASPVGVVADGMTSGVLIIESMPTHLRSAIEEAMVECLQSESTWVVPGDDPLTAQWCTRWHKDWPGTDMVSLAAGCVPETRVAPGIGCRQVLTGTAAELRALEERVQALALRYGFTARLSK